MYVKLGPPVSALGLSWRLQRLQMFLNFELPKGLEIKVGSSPHWCGEGEVSFSPPHSFSQHCPHPMVLLPLPEKSCTCPPESKAKEEECPPHQDSCLSQGDNWCFFLESLLLSLRSRLATCRRHRARLKTPIAIAMSPLIAP